MRTSHHGISLIKHFEGLSTKAYKCPEGVPTIGYGHTGKDVKLGMVITAQQAENLLRSDLGYFERSIEQALNAGEIEVTQGQFDALVCFAFNVGIGALLGSTLWRELQAGDYEGAADQFLRWTKSGGRELPGLVKRRRAERELFLS